MLLGYINPAGCREVGGIYEVRTGSIFSKKFPLLSVKFSHWFLQNWKEAIHSQQLCHYSFARKFPVTLFSHPVPRI
ncbi:MAG: hypothetical protein QW115_05345, partial [Thermoplasmata archaeon]